MKLDFFHLLLGAQELQIHSLKATIKIRIDVPSELTALSKMSITDEKLNQNIKTVYLFDHIEETTADGMHIWQRLIQLPFFGVYKMIIAMCMQESRFVYFVLLERVIMGSLLWMFLSRNLTYLLDTLPFLFFLFMLRFWILCSSILSSLKSKSNVYRKVSFSILSFLTSQRTEWISFFFFPSFLSIDWLKHKGTI